MTVLHPVSLSSDPLYGGRLKSTKKGFYREAKIYPAALCENISASSLTKWESSLSQEQIPAPLDIKAPSSGIIDLLFDFGTELEGFLVVEVLAENTANIYATFGESFYEAKNYGVTGTVASCPHPCEHIFIAGKGKSKHEFASRGFRFVRLTIHDVKTKITLSKIYVKASFAFADGMKGDFLCDDKKLLRTYHASLYTARLCAREDMLWDGIKRDRHGWYGDARVTQEAIDAGFFNKESIMNMLEKLETDKWANAIPGYSFDAIASLARLILKYEPDKRYADIYAKMKALLSWVEETQTNKSGFMVRNREVKYFFNAAYLDWSPMPVGGRFEELSWLQFKYIEALKNASFIAFYLGKNSDASDFRKKAYDLEKKVKKTFYRKGLGYIHTLNKSVKEWKMYDNNEHYKTTYEEKIKLGESYPTRQAGALAVFAGCNDEKINKDILSVFESKSIHPIITGYFAYYEQIARAKLGDKKGALEAMLGYIGEQVHKFDSACVWESYEPLVEDFRLWGLSAWPKSLCHGWSSGIVPLVNEYIVGVSSYSPEYKSVSITPANEVALAFNAKIPTPYGNIDIKREKKDGKILAKVPKQIEVSVSSGVEISRKK